MDDKFKESQTNLTNLEIDLKEIQNILKRYSQLFFNLSKTNFSLSSSKGITPLKQDGAPYFIKKLLDYINSMQKEMEAYGSNMSENILTINKMLEKITKMKKNQNFVYDNCKKRINYVQNEFDNIRKKLSSKSKTKSKLEFDRDFQQMFNCEKLQNKSTGEVKSKIILCEFEDLERKENAIFENLESAHNLIQIETENCSKDSDLLKKNFNMSLSQNLQNISQKNVNLLKSLRKINEKHLGIDKLDQISQQITTNSQNDFNISKQSKPPLILSSLSMKEIKEKMHNHSLSKSKNPKNPENGFKQELKLNLSNKFQRSLGNILNELDLDERISNGNDSMKCIERSIYENERNGQKINKNLKMLNSLKIISKSNSSINLNKNSICSLSTRDEELKLKNFDCFDFNEKRLKKTNTTIHK